jgi:histone-lysine N-methyltransferase SETMAR
MLSRNQSISQGQTVNQAYYMEMLKWLHESMHRKSPELWPSDLILHHDNDPAHKALSAKQFVTQKSITEMEHPPYSLDLAPNDFWLFPQIKPALKGRRFQDIEYIHKKKKNVTTALKAVPQQKFQKYFQQ